MTEEDDPAFIIMIYQDGALVKFCRAFSDGCGRRAGVDW